MGEVDALTIGRIVGCHGVRGHLKVLSDADSVEFFPPGKELLLITENGASESYCISSCRRHKGLFLLALEGIESIDAAERWRGGEIQVGKETLPPVQPGTYYVYELIGLAVVDSDERYLGRVEEIFPTGSNDVYVVRNGVKEVLIPAIDSVVLAVDLDAGLIRVDLPEGLEG